MAANTPETREKLAKHIVDNMVIGEALRAYQMRLEEDFDKDDECFHDKWNETFGDQHEEQNA